MLKLKYKIVKVVSYFMLIIFLMGVAPKEYLHDLLYSHHDDVHLPLKEGEFVFHGDHKHCSFLGFVFAPFIASEKHFLVFKEQSVFTTYIPAIYFSCKLAAQDVISLRGPPIL